MSDIPSPGNIDLVTSTQLHFSRLRSLQNRIGAADGTESALTEQQRAEFAKAARGFESMFVNMMMKQMRESMLDKEDAEDGSMSFGADTLEGYTDLQFADFVAAGNGLGIAQQVYEYLTGGERLAPSTQHTGAQQPTGAADRQSAPAPAPTPSPLQPRGNFLDRVTARLQPYDAIIRRAAERYNVPEALIRGIITAESAGNPQAQSGAGAKGLMQLMDATARDLGVRNSFDPEENIMGGTKYIRDMLNAFGGDERIALAAYNAGPGNVRKYNGIPPFSETQAYVRNVLRYTAQYRDAAQGPDV